MENPQKILKKVGIVLIVVGILDIAFMIYCIIHETNYSSSFNLFAVIAGILLYRGGLKTAKVVSFFAAFFLAGMGGLLIVFPIFIPIDLLFTYIKLSPFASLGYLIFGTFIIVFLVWILKTLTSRPIKVAMDQNGINRKSFFSRPRSGFIAGIILLLTLVGLLPLILGGETAEMAKIEAQKKIVGNYKYVVTSINIHSNLSGKTYVNAVITAYTDNEIQQIPVSFEK
ncbi:MAG: hypothetical protein GY699_15005 [Desulfobacteraceae bacterium]|nr:hypothetical protein [Desulfobacteraceae bacterium]